MQEKQSLFNLLKAEDILYFYYDNNQKKTIIIMANHNSYFYMGSCKMLLQQLCMKYGSTLQGRIAFVAKAADAAKKIPVLISERNEVIVFPLFGYRNEEAFWIAYQQVKKIHNEEDLTTRILFKNNTMIEIAISYRSIAKQLRRCKTVIKLLNHL